MGYRLRLNWMTSRYLPPLMSYDAHEEETQKALNEQDCVTECSVTTHKAKEEERNQERSRGWGV